MAVSPGVMQVWLDEHVNEIEVFVKPRILFWTDGSP